MRPGNRATKKRQKEQSSAAFFSARADVRPSGRLIPGTANLKGTKILGGSEKTFLRIRALKDA